MIKKIGLLLFLALLSGCASSDFIVLNSGSTNISGSIWEENASQSAIQINDSFSQNVLVDEDAGIYFGNTSTSRGYLELNSVSDRPTIMTRLSSNFDAGLSVDEFCFNSFFCFPSITSTLNFFGVRPILYVTGTPGSPQHGSILITSGLYDSVTDTDFLQLRDVSGNPQIFANYGDLAIISGSGAGDTIIQSANVNATSKLNVGLDLNVTNDGFIGNDLEVLNNSTFKGNVTVEKNALVYLEENGTNSADIQGKTATYCFGDGKTTVSQYLDNGNVPCTGSTCARMPGAGSIRSINAQFNGANTGFSSTVISFDSRINGVDKLGTSVILAPASVNFEVDADATRGLHTFNNAQTLGCYFDKGLGTISGSKVRCCITVQFDGFT